MARITVSRPPPRPPYRPTSFVSRAADRGPAEPNPQKPSTSTVGFIKEK